MNRIEQQLEWLARRQHQVFSRRQALEAGMSSSAISRRVQSRTFVACGTSSLHFGGVELTFQGRLMAGLLDIDRPALVSGGAAARLLGLDGFDRHKRPEYLVERLHRHRRANGPVHSISEFQEPDRWRVGGLPCASATMAIVELFAHGTDADNALDSACRQHLTTIPAVRDRFAQLVGPGRAGVARFERADSGGRRVLARAQVRRAVAIGRSPVAGHPGAAFPRRRRGGARRLRVRAAADRRRGRRPPRVSDARRAAAERNVGATLSSSPARPSTSSRATTSSMTRPTSSRRLLARSACRCRPSARREMASGRNDRGVRLGSCRIPG